MLYKKRKKGLVLNLRLLKGLNRILVLVVILLLMINIIVFFYYEDRKYYVFETSENVEDYIVSKDGKEALLKVNEYVKKSSLEDVEGVEFFVVDKSGEEYSFDTDYNPEEIKNLGDIDEDGFYEDDLENRTIGEFQYRISSEDFGMKDFRDIVKIFVIFRIKIRNQDRPLPKIDDDKFSIKDLKDPSLRTGGGGGSSGGGGDPLPSCVPKCSGKVCGDDSCGGSCGVCDDNNDCTIDRCNLGKCDIENVLNGTICSLGICQEGICVACTSNLECDDNIVCTYDSCNLGKCVNSPDNSLCLINQICDNLYGCVDEIHMTKEWLNAQENPDGPYYLDNEGANYILETDVVTNGTAFVIIANGITFDLNHHTIIFDETEPIIIDNFDFEKETGKNITNWDLTSADNISVQSGSFVRPVSVYSGKNAVKIQMPCEDQEIKSVKEVNLEPNTTYTISAMFYNIGYRNNVDNVELYVGLENSDIETKRSGVTWRGFQYQEFEFKTGEDNLNHRIVAGIRNADEVSTLSHSYIDDIKIQKTRNFGIIAGVASWASSSFPDINRYTGRLSDIIIKNGNVIQGKGGSSNIRGVYPAYLRSAEVYDMDITCYGANGVILSGGYDWSARNIKFHDNILNSNVRTLYSRDNFYATVLSVNSRGNVSIYDNVITNGPHAGIMISNRDPNGILKIYRNNISLRTFYTNDFAIMGTGEVYENNIDCLSGDYSCRGIMVGANAMIHDNKVMVKQISRNQEYDGCQYGGGYGIQAEATKNAFVYNNEVVAIANECSSTAFRGNPEAEAGGGDNVKVYNNSFKAISVNDNNEGAFSIKLSHATNDAFEIFDNVLITNRAWYSFDGRVVGMDFKNNLHVFENPRSVERPLRTYDWNGNIYPDKIRIINPRFNSDYERILLTNSSVIRGFSQAFFNLFDENASFYVSYSVDIDVLDNLNPLSSANVDIVNHNNEIIFSGLTDSDGKISVILDEFYNLGGVKTEYNPYMITISKSGYDSISRSITVNEQLDISADMSNGVIDINSGPELLSLKTEPNSIFNRFLKLIFNFL